MARVVEAAESQLHAGLEAMYSDMANSTAKALRRVMPITKMKMKWSVNDLALKGGAHQGGAGLRRDYVACPGGGSDGAIRCAIAAQECPGTTPYYLLRGVLRARFPPHEPRPQDPPIFPHRVRQQALVAIQFGPPLHDVHQQRRA